MIMQPNGRDGFIATVVEKGYGAWLVGCRICRSLDIMATTKDGPVPTPFGLFSGPGDPKNND
jgi:hypothetical protein